MGTSDTKKANRYIKKHYDRINLIVKTGRKAELEEAAIAECMSVNAYINACIDDSQRRSISSRAISVRYAEAEEEMDTADQLIKVLLGACEAEMMSVRKTEAYKRLISMTKNVSNP